MSKRTSGQAFARAANDMVHAVPAGDILSRLVRDCVEVVEAAEVAILVRDDRDVLSLLTSSSATASQLELLQAMDYTGPCVDVISSGETQSAAGDREMTRRWGEVGEAIAGAGFASVHAYPLRWQDRPLGGLNVFRRDVPAEDSVFDPVCQAFADVATIVMVHASEIQADEITARIHRATSARTLVEQAKGVLAELHDLDVERAGQRLEQIASEEGLTLSDAAQAVISRAVTSRPPR